ncbi:MAG TPA: hypothetical protein VM901_07770 [Bdellovibrionota bacterium]|jgi:serine/threonine protein kinase|nr:hypothetical protein [Bdellovibrionota bacterium]
MILRALFLFALSLSVTRPALAQPSALRGFCNTLIEWASGRIAYETPFVDPKHTLISLQIEELLKESQYNNSPTIISEAQKNFLSITKLYIKGTKTPKYDIEKLIAKGGNSIVFKAWDNELKRPIALRIPITVNHDIRKSYEKDYRIAREAEQAYGQQSPLPFAYDQQVVHGIPLLAMEYFAQADFGKAWVEGYKEESSEMPLLKSSLLEMVEIGLSISRFHNLGYIHGDIKAQNAIVQTPRGAVLLDTETSGAIDPKTGTAKKGMPKFYTEGSAAPEFVRYSKEPGDDASSITTAIDVYSFAQMLDRSFTSYAANLISERKLSNEPKLDKIYAFHDKFLLKALVDDPRQRPTILEISQALAILCAETF